VSGHRFDCVHIQNSTLAGGVVMGVAAGLDMHPSSPIGIGFVTGAISVLGYKYLTPLLSRIGVQVRFYPSFAFVGRGLRPFA
jgi:ammonium transporter Rh